MMLLDSIFDKTLAGITVLTTIVAGIFAAVAGKHKREVDAVTRRAQLAEGRAQQVDAENKLLKSKAATLDAARQQLAKIRQHQKEENDAIDNAIPDRTGLDNSY